MGLCVLFRERETEKRGMTRKHGGLSDGGDVTTARAGNQKDYSTNHGMDATARRKSDVAGVRTN